MVYGVRSRSETPRRLLPITSIGYAAPGAVLGVGILIPLAWFDNRLADGIWELTGYDIGLILTGTSAAIIYAYCVRFFAIAQEQRMQRWGAFHPIWQMRRVPLGATDCKH